MPDGIGEWLLFVVMCIPVVYCFWRIVEGAYYYCKKD